MEEQLYKVDISRITLEGNVYIVKANSKKGKLLSGKALTKKDAKKAAGHFLRSYKDDKSLIKYMSSNVFFKMIKDLDYKAIVQLCAPSNLYRQFCEYKGVWFYLLKRDFNPLLQADIDLLDNKEIEPKELYYRIQRENISPAEQLYKRYEKRALIELCVQKQQNYYGAQWLLKVKNIDPSDLDNWAIGMASENGHIEVVRLLLQDERVDPSATKNEAIRVASAAGHVKVVELLLQDERVDPSDDDNEAIIMASENGHIEVVRLLLQDERINPSTDDNYPIKLASESGHLEVVRLLLQDERVRNSLSVEVVKNFITHFLGDAL